MWLKGQSVAFPHLVQPILSRPEHEVHLLCCKAMMTPRTSLYSTFDLITPKLKSYSALSLQHHQIIGLRPRDYGLCDAPQEQKNKLKPMEIHSAKEGCINLGCKLALRYEGWHKKNIRHHAKIIVHVSNSVCKGCFHNMPCLVYLFIVY